MKDRELGYLLTAKTRLIDPNDARGEFGMGGQDDSNVIMQPVPPTGTPMRRPVSSPYKKLAVILNQGLLACVNVIGLGLGEIATSIISVKESFVLRESSHDTEVLGLMHQLQSRINFLQKQGGHEATTCARALQKKLNAYEDGILGP